MEQKINGVWMNLEGMTVENLHYWHNACLESLDQLGEDIAKIGEEIVKRANQLESVQPESFSLK